MDNWVVEINGSEYEMTPCVRWFHKPIDGQPVISDKPTLQQLMIKRPGKIHVWIDVTTVVGNEAEKR